MMRPPMRRKRKRLNQTRRGAATVELAVLLPILLFLCFGTIEITSRLFLRQSAAVAAYEGARLAARRTVSADTVRERCQQLLADRRIQGAVVVVTPASTSDVSTGGLIQVQITVPYAGNTPAAFVIASGSSLQVTASMLRE